MKKAVFGNTEDGQEVHIFHLSNGKIEAEIINYGAILKSLKTPDRNGKLGDVVLGFDDLEGYLGPHPCFGTVNGRFANRIAKGKFFLKGFEFNLAINNGPNHLHGGLKGFDKVLWDYELVDGVEGVKLIYNSPHGEEGYPGNLRVEVTYQLTDRNGLKIDYRAETDQDTVLNLTNHTYFNLALEGNAMDHELKIHAGAYTPTDETNIPTGEFFKVSDSPFDFREFKRISQHIGVPHEQLDYGSGYDHNFVLNGTNGKFRLVAEVKESMTGRNMEVYSSEPGLQLYTANHLDGIKGKGDLVYHARDAFCLELQHFPDSPNHPHFPTTQLKPGATYRQTTEYRFPL